MLNITPGFGEERPGAVRALREVHDIPVEFELIVGDGYIRFWGSGITAEQARPFTARDVTQAVLLFFGPPSCACPEIGEWDQIH